MTWARLDDRTATSPEWVGLADVALRAARTELPTATPPQVSSRARELARDAKFVHLVSLMWSVPALSDGRLSPSAVDQICAIGSLTADEWYAGAELLVAVKAWKRLKPTKAEPLGSYQMILGWAPGEQPTRQEDEDRRKRARLRDALRPGAKDYPKRLEAVERSEGLCEYCDADNPTEIDHVDPTLFSNEICNLAYVCASCNKTKGLHQLGDVGMAFTQRAADARHAWSTRGSTCGSRVDTVSDRVGSGRVGKGKGAGRAGSGRGRPGREAAPEPDIEPSSTEPSSLASVPPPDDRHYPGDAA